MSALSGLIFVILSVFSRVSYELIECTTVLDFIYIYFPNKTCDW